MKAKAFIFFGRSGSGKGTQAELLLAYLKERDPERKIVHIETGARFRELMEHDNFTSKRIKEILACGDLLPEFLPIWVYTDYLVQHFTGDEHIVIDGAARRIAEAPIIEDAIKFYSESKPYIIFLDVSRERSKEHLLKRGRDDDGEAGIERRLNWFETSVGPVVEYFRTSPHVEFIEIDGEQSIEKIHEDIVKSISWE